ncbi:hypothetical protein [Roseicyclus sp.]|uniref:hypothetical protein n=1 Tax=Roseicyclus sp. TaxID=1914329 RepID=UPI0040548F3F
MFAFLLPHCCDCLAVFRADAWRIATSMMMRAMSKNAPSTPQPPVPRTPPAPPFRFSDWASL